MADPSPGDVVSDRYRLLQRLGAGAHGVVFKARDLETRDEVAIKFLSQGLDPELNQRLQREAVAMARLRGTGAVYLHRLGLLPDGTSYLVMEMLYGQDFEEYLRAAEAAGGRLKADRMLSILRPVVDTLETAHQSGIVHRDLKPSNVFIVEPERGGGTRLLDFGLVKIVNAVRLTQSGMVAGTPSYIAPEVWEGRPEIVDARADQFSLGVLVFRALSGRLPQPTGSPIELMVWARAGARPSLRALRPKLPDGIDAWVGRALAPAPGGRFESVRALWNGLEALLGKAPAAPF
jgi:eukaryotic-like serine/threonine-protein kinase